MAPTRGGEIHEATRRILSVLLQRLEGFDGRSRNILVCATNRKEDLDKALISRFNVIIKFDLPDTQTRAAIFKMYAKQLSFEACSDLSELSNGISCRGIKDVCEHTERKHASAMIGKLILGRNIQNIYDIASSVPLPKHKDYAEQVTQYQISHEKYNCEKGKYRT